jgi:hypothetical protein
MSPIYRVIILDFPHGGIPILILILIRVLLFSHRGRSMSWSFRPDHNPPVRGEIGTNIFDLLLTIMMLCSRARAFGDTVKFRIDMLNVGMSRHEGELRVKVKDCDGKTDSHLLRSAQMIRKGDIPSACLAPPPLHLP